QIDVKKAGIFAITDGVKALAIEAGRLQGSTHDRREALVEAGVLKPEQVADLRAAFDFLVLMRLRGQVGALRSNATPSNYIALEHLNALEQGDLRLAFEGVAKFQTVIGHHFLRPVPGRAARARSAVPDRQAVHAEWGL